MRKKKSVTSLLSSEKVTQEGGKDYCCDVQGTACPNEQDSRSGGATSALLEVPMTPILCLHKQCKCSANVSL